MNPQTTKGFQDFIGEQAIKRSEIRKIIEETFQLYGFEPAETPIIEQEEFVKGENQNDEAVSDIFKLQDKGKRKLALRYEFTFQLKRISKNQKLPYKRYQIGPVFRDEPVSSNRFRQFTQCDIDIIGSKLKDEAEVLATIKTISDKLGIKLAIYVNNRKLINEILEEQKIKNKQEVIKEIDKLDKQPESEVKKNLKKYNAEKILEIFKKPEKYFEKYNSYEEIKQLKKSCKDYDVKIEFNPSLARGLSYYNGTVFEAKTKNSNQSVVGGGAFLVNGIQSIGYGSGLERWCSLAKIKTPKIKYLIISINQDKKAIALAEKLRSQNISCIISFDKISKALEYANSKNILNTIFIGADEVKKNKFKVKDMETGKERMVGEKDLLEKDNLKNDNYLGTK